MNPIRILFYWSLMLICLQAGAQENKIVKLLNQQLKKEQKKYPAEDSLFILQPFRINEDHQLSIQFSRYDRFNEATDIITRTVDLRKVKRLVKDINVLFETEADAVNIVTTTVLKTGIKEPPTEQKYYLFFTELCTVLSDESFKEKLLEAFSKAGYAIECEIWAD